MHFSTDQDWLKRSSLLVLAAVLATTAMAQDAVPAMDDPHLKVIPRTASELSLIHI